MELPAFLGVNAAVSCVYTKALRVQSKIGYAHWSQVVNAHLLRFPAKKLLLEMGYISWKIGRNKSKEQPYAQQDLLIKLFTISFKIAMQY